MTRKCQVRFGGGAMEKYQPENWQLAGVLPNKVHLTETCDDDLPRLIVHVATTTGPTADDAVTPHIHADLQRRALLPSTHIVDTGFLDAALLVRSKTVGAASNGVTTGGWSRVCSGSCTPGLRGASCRRNTAPGRPVTAATRAGGSTAPGRASSPPSRRLPPTRGSPGKGNRSSATQSLSATTVPGPPSRGIHTAPQPTGAASPAKVAPRTAR